MTVDEHIVMLREYSERGSEGDFAEAADFLEAFQYESKEYRKQMTTQVARIKQLEAALDDIMQSFPRADWYFLKPETRAALEKKHD